MVQVSEFVRDARGPRHGADWARPQGEGGPQHRHPDVEPPRQHGVQGLRQCNPRVISVCELVRSGTEKYIS